MVQVAPATIRWIIIVHWSPQLISLEVANEEKIKQVIRIFCLRDNHLIPHILTLNLFWEYSKGVVYVIYLPEIGNSPYQGRNQVLVQVSVMKTYDLKINTYLLVLEFRNSVMDPDLWIHLLEIVDLDRIPRGSRSKENLFPRSVLVSTYKWKFGRMTLLGRFRQRLL